MKKNSIWRSASPKCCVIEGRRGRRTWRTVRRPGVKQQNVFSQPRFGDNNTDFHVACTPKPAMSLGIRETLAALVVRRPSKVGRVTFDDIYFFHWSCDGQARFTVSHSTTFTSHKQIKTSAKAKLSAVHINTYVQVYIHICMYVCMYGSYKYMCKSI